MWLKTLPKPGELQQKKTECWTSSRPGSPDFHLHVVAAFSRVSKVEMLPKFEEVLQEQSFEVRCYQNLRRYQKMKETKFWSGGFSGSGPPDFRFCNIFTLPTREEAPTTCEMKIGRSWSWRRSALCVCCTSPGFGKMFTSKLYLLMHLRFRQGCQSKCCKT